MYENEEYDHSYSLEIPFPFLVLETGEFLVGHYVECRKCKSSYPAYLNMSKVSQDKIEEANCIHCGSEGLDIITYKLKTLGE